MPQLLEDEFMCWQTTHAVRHRKGMAKHSVDSLATAVEEMASEAAYATHVSCHHATTMLQPAEVAEAEGPVPHRGRLIQMVGAAGEGEPVALLLPMVAAGSGQLKAFDHVWPQSPATMRRRSYLFRYHLPEEFPKTVRIAVLILALQHSD